MTTRNIAYYPPAFSPGSCTVLRRLFPDAVVATEHDAAVLGLNAVSDGLNVVLSAEAEHLAQQLRETRPPAHRRRPVRTPQGRWRRQVLLAGDPAMTGRECPGRARSTDRATTDEIGVGSVLPNDDQTNEKGIAAMKPGSWLPRPHMFRFHDPLHTRRTYKTWSQAQQ